MAILDGNVAGSCLRRVTVDVLAVSLALGASSSLSAAPVDDLTMTFAAESVAGEAGNIIGAVTNNSHLRYPCVDALFSLSSHFDDRQEGLPVVSYGTQTIRIVDIAPGATRRFSAPLARKAGFGFVRYQACAEPVADNAPPERARACEVTGSIASQTRFEGLDDRRQRQVIERVYVLEAADRQLVTEVALGKGETRVTDHRTGRSYTRRSYSVSGLSANRRYIVRLSNAWRTEPTEVAFDCPVASGHSTFRLPMLRHTGNRLGG